MKEILSMKLIASGRSPGVYARHILTISHSLRTLVFTIGRAGLFAASVLQPVDLWVGPVIAELYVNPSKGTTKRSTQYEKNGLPQHHFIEVNVAGHDKSADSTHSRPKRRMDCRSW